MTGMYEAAQTAYNLFRVSIWSCVVFGVLSAYTIFQKKERPLIAVTVFGCVMFFFLSCIMKHLSVHG